MGTKTKTKATTFRNHDFFFFFYKKNEDSECMVSDVTDDDKYMVQASCTVLSLSLHRKISSSINFYK